MTAVTAQANDRMTGRQAGEGIPSAIEKESLGDEPAAAEESQPEEKTETSDKAAPEDNTGHKQADDTKSETIEEAKAPAKKQENKPAKLLKVDFADLESKGLYYSPQDGSLGRDLWSHTRRSAVLEYLPALPSAGESPLLQIFTNGLLLSKANADLIENDVAPEPGQDILTLRLMKLMDLGMTDQALKIYSDLGQPPYHPNLAQAGIMALLFNAEKSLACLEYKTVEDRNFSGEFWTDIALYCDYVLEDKKPPSAALENINSTAVKRILSGGAFTFSYDAKKLAAVPLFDRAILTAENIINFGGLGMDGIRRISPEHLTLALKKPNLSKQDEFLITMKMVEYGLKSRIEWEKTYAGYKFGGAADEQKVIDVDALPGWQHLPALYQNAKAVGKGAQQQAILMQALNYINTYGPASIYPFADMLLALPADNLSTGELSKIARIAHGADKDIPASWFDSLKKRKLGGERETALFMIAYLSKAYQRAGSEDKNVIIKAVESINNSKLKESFIIIIENVDKPLTEQHNAGRVYENDLDLTFAGSYVMPSKRVWDRLIASSQDQRIGETVLLGTLLLNGKTVMDLYPGVLSDILESLRAVGLTRFSKSMAQEALLEVL
ncbi:MAG: hypothetical protein LRY76_08365 [Alphaproteobacteria bacterium]|nr:hypothetical protein [Alphaproteobacteria bacterium]